ncbi:MAG: hypothetical protein CMI62_06365 [Parvibaculum sp.]|jgi:hypothetical protein|uniref:hypothetical protein n=1 Tax=Parvibaculum sp. TaxID=2024848 RepID=UPI000C369675|nr:hypothetical protein [Parvibaculum sp.]MAU60339.1 hypothetical protein [Parvibaculum sp.]HAC56907.1 hypothetical protein [Rhodobiaceae bacterium]|tara:strand:- start:7436 stop:8458 length:1023 start_codon:yes stop_codon:yes gene_type:complete
MTMSKYAPAYLVTLAATVIVCGLAVFAFNAAVDPLWYFGGNKVGNVNYAFNERLSKTNLFLSRQGEYDCVIFGDSRVTLLPEQKIEGYRCFNFAFSAGKAEEALAYARYLGSTGFSPRLVIMGVPGAAFRERIGGTDIPEFVREGQAPKSPYLAYLSLDALFMSWQTLFGASPLDRIYDETFTCRVAPGSPDYDPAVPIRDIFAGRFTGTQRVSFYDDMREIFPNAELVGYVPPISAWAIKAYADRGWLKDYIEAIHLASTKFDRFKDYGVPSAMTTNVGNTYDGTHYSEESNSLIASNLLLQEDDGSLNLKKLDVREMTSIYAARLKRYEPVLKEALKN